MPNGLVGNVYHAVVPIWFIKGLVVCKTVFRAFLKEYGLSPGSGFLSDADMSITVPKEDVKRQLTNIYTA